MVLLLLGLAHILIAVAANDAQPKQEAGNLANAPGTDSNTSGSSRLNALSERLSFGAENVETVWLGENPNKHLALYQQPDTADANGAVITILAGGKILEQSELSRSLRQTLAAGDWASLVVQSETMTAGKVKLPTAEQVQALLSNALAYVQQQGYSKFVLIAEGEIASQAWPLVQTGNQAIIGFVGLDQWSASEFKPHIPVLNVANSAFPLAVTNARRRFNLVKRTPSAACEVYFYDGNLGSDSGFGQLVSQRIRGWLKRKFADAS